MNPGELNKRIRIQRQKVITDIEEGLPKKKWIDLGTESEQEEIFRWAKWEWLHGNEFWKAAAINSKVVAQVTIRYIKSLKPDMRILFKGEAYSILPPIDNIREKDAYITFKVFTVESG